jgi:hypothetical protein
MNNKIIFRRMILSPISKKEFDREDDVFKLVRCKKRMNYKNEWYFKLVGMVEYKKDKEEHI